MEQAADSEVMGTLVIIATLLLIGPLSILYGADSRRWDDTDRRGWWPASPRR